MLAFAVPAQAAGTACHKGVFLMQRKSLMIKPGDLVACVLEDAQKGDTIVTAAGETVVLLEDIEFAHKVCIKDLAKNEPVIKYGEEIGYMLTDVKKGTWIHNHNMGCDRGKK